jgi:hypothetical protein
VLLDVLVVLSELELCELELCELADDRDEALLALDAEEALDALDVVIVWLVVCELALLVE